ncbi:Cyclin-dependent kinase inhibitor 5 [Apostasia shenzhenica]|uniref:Cyclin-dependent kinase inhibitor n=1 Tax=Apostasia shenzhenica TaxID=1088818 RepID=A0A2I0A9B3_9ASPA|nr:Cyclin-dependent kinase inhibitor 5 [Apostasia shenzhenica]
MGKYIRKARLTGEAAVMEVSAQVSIGVRTRARTLALQRMQKPSASSAIDNSVSSSSYLQLRNRRLEKPFVALKSKVPPEEADVVVEVSFGENVLEAEQRERTTRETTPCSMIRSSETIRTPSSTTRRPTSTPASNHLAQNLMQRNIPTALEMEEFFAGTERLQQRRFIEKYNFDPVNDCPLPGRYEWLKLADS